MPNRDAIDMLKDLLDSITENNRTQDEINKLNMQAYKLLNEKIDLLKERMENLHTSEDLKKADMQPTRTPLTPVMPSGLELL